MKAELVLGNLKREREALDARLEKLDIALSKEWEDKNQEYLCTQQYNAMSLYAHILDERIFDIECKLEQRRLEKEERKSHETSHNTDNIFKDKIDPNSYKDYAKDNCCKKTKCDNSYDEQELPDVVKDIITCIFGEGIV